VLKKAIREVIFSSRVSPTQQDQPFHNPIATSTEPGYSAEDVQNVGNSVAWRFHNIIPLTILPGMDFLRFSQIFH
jgi:hypothetical protein